LVDMDVVLGPTKDVDPGTCVNDIVSNIQVQHIALLKLIQFFSEL